MSGARRRRSAALGRVVRPTIGRLALTVFRTRFLGAENVPEGGAVLAGNHVSYLDPILLWSGSPRPVRFMAKKELFSGWMGFLLERFWAFPVDREGADRAAIQRATEELRAGDLVGIFPEGTRREGDEPGEVHGGAAFVAMRAGVPVVPVAFVGTDTAWPRGVRLPRPARVTIKYGAPVHPDAFGGHRKGRVEAMTVEIMRRIAEEVDAARRLHDAR